MRREAVYSGTEPASYVTEYTLEYKDLADEGADMIVVSDAKGDGTMNA
jgi:hypothetical protein